MGKKKEKIVDLKPEVDKISDEHLSEIQTLVNKINKIQFQIGAVELQKHTMLHDLAVTQDGIALMQDKLYKEYGTYDVNIQDGSINKTEQNDG
tara:strand:- start:149 stop:427 length:279 start_codon:yes stop_codon:yes gene_type:complete